MRKVMIVIIVAIFSNGLGGCECQPTTPTLLKTRYTPLHPADHVDITFKFEAEDGDGISKARLYVYEYELYVSSNRMRSARARSGGTWGLVQTWNYPAEPQSVLEEKTIDGFPASSFIRYLVSITDANGSEKNEDWTFAAGSWPWGNSPIPIWVNGAPAQRIDIAFVADRDDYTQGSNMLADLEQLIFDGYHTNNGVKLGKRFWQFYYSPELGFISDYNSGSPYTMDIPSSVTDEGIIDHAAVIHTTAKRDWANGGNFGTEPFNVGTAVHESGHSAFGLSDEYSGGGHWTSNDHYHNNYDTEQACQDYNTRRGWPPGDCELIETGWWRPEPATLKCIMWNDGDNTMPNFARSCYLRALWFYLELI